MRSRRPVGATGFGLLAECPVAGVFCEQARLRDAKSRDAGAQSWMCISYEAKHPSSIPVVVARCDNSGIVNHSQPPEPWPVQLWSLRDRQECAALTSPMIARAEMQVLSAVVLRWFQVFRVQFDRTSLNFDRKICRCETEREAVASLVRDAKTDFGGVGVIYLRRVLCLPSLENASSHDAMQCVTKKMGREGCSSTGVGPPLFPGGTQIFFSHASFLPSCIDWLQVRCLGASDTLRHSWSALLLSDGAFSEP